MKQKTNKGITLIALVITIIVMLILVSVTINMAVNGGLFSYASKASKDTENAYSYEQGILSGRMKVGGIWYDSPEDYVANKPSGSQNDLPVSKIATVTNIKLGVATAAGTEDDPIYVYSVEDLVLLAENVNNGDTYDGKYLKMVRDIDFEDNNCYLDASIKSDLIDRNGEGFYSIGVNYPFKGTFDGTNHEIKNFYKNKAKIGGLFGRVQGATIENLGISGSICAPSAAGLVGIVETSSNETIIQNCYNKCEITHASDLGGIVAINAGGNLRIVDCYNSGSITGGCAGGIIGQGSNSAVIENCYNEGTVDSNGTACGIAYTNAKDIINCYNVGNITGKGNVCGIAWSAANIINSYNKGNVLGEDCVVYGIGSATNSIINCYNNGSITGTGWVMGVGSTNSAGSILNSYNNGILMGSNVVGVGHGTNIKNCYNSGKLSGSTGKYPITSSSSNVITNCYYLSSEVSEGYSTTDAESVPMTAAQMKASSFVTTLNNNLSSMTKINNIDFYQWKYVANSYPQFNR